MKSSALVVIDLQNDITKTRVALSLVLTKLCRGFKLINRNFGGSGNEIEESYAGGNRYR